MKWKKHVAYTGAVRALHKYLVGNPEEKRLLGRPSCRWEDKIKVDQKYFVSCVNWSHWTHNMYKYCDANNNVLSSVHMILELPVD